MLKKKEVPWYSSHRRIQDNIVNRRHHSCRLHWNTFCDCMFFVYVKIIIYIEKYEKSHHSSLKKI